MGPSKQRSIDALAGSGKTRASYQGIASAMPQKKRSRHEQKLRGFLF
jgi:hypothetical protein